MVLYEGKKNNNDLSLFFVRGGELEIKGKEQSVMIHQRPFL
jgi:hypothetical protein